MNKTGKGIEPDKTTASGKLFFGAEIGGEAVGKCEWDNPDKRPDPKTPAWCTFASIGYGLKAAVGFAGEFEFKITYNSAGKFSMAVRAGLVFGVGAGGGVVASIDADTIMDFIQFVYHQLKKHDYTLIEAIATDAFEAIIQLSVWAIETGKEIGEWVEDTREAIEESVNSIVGKVNEAAAWWFERTVSIEQARKLANRILKEPEILKYTTPEAKGIMLHTLTKMHNEITAKHKDNRGVLILSRIAGTAEEDQLELQERAIIGVLKCIQTRSEYYKVCKRISADGSENGTKEDGHDKISKILDGMEAVIFRNLRWKWTLDAADWRTGYKEAYEDVIKKDSPVEVKTLIV